VFDEKNRSKGANPGERESVKENLKSDFHAGAGGIRLKSRNCVLFASFLEKNQKTLSSD